MAMRRWDRLVDGYVEEYRARRAGLEAPIGVGVLTIQTTVVPEGRLLFRFHKSPTTYHANSFNPNTGKHIDMPEEGTRFNPFPGAPSANVATLYAADKLSAAALEG